MLVQKETKSCLFIIALNGYFYVLVHFTAQPERLISSLILSPAGLLKGNLLSVVTSGFIHYDFIHFLLNMLGVFVFGRIVERHFGALKTFFIYFGALVISMLFATLVNYFVLHTNVAIIGASGAVMGLLATAMLLDPYAITYEMIFPMPVMMKGWLYLYADLRGLVSPVADGISHLTHIFGYCSIGVLVYFLSRKDKKILKEGLLVNVFSLIIFVIAWRVLYILKSTSN